MFLSPLLKWKTPLSWELLFSLFDDSLQTFWIAAGSITTAVVAAIALVPIVFGALERRERRHKVRLMTTMSLADILSYIVVIHCEGNAHFGHSLSTPHALVMRSKLESLKDEWLLLTGTEVALLVAASSMMDLISDTGEMPDITAVSTYNSFYMSLLAAADALSKAAGERPPSEHYELGLRAQVRVATELRENMRRSGD